MRILEQDPKRGSMKIQVESLDDLYWLFTVIEPGDLVTMRTARRIKQDGVRADSGERIPMTLTVEVEKVKIDPHSQRLRVLGVVRVGPERYGIQGQHHTLNISEGSVIKLVKKRWERAHLRILERAVEASKRENVLLIAMDDDGATFALAGPYRVEELMFVRAHLPSKRGDLRGREGEERKYFAELRKVLANLVDRYKPKAVLIGGPGYTKEKFLSYLRSEDERLASLVRVGGATSSTFSGIMEMLRRGDLEKVAKEITVTRDLEEVEEIFTLVARDSKLVTYGLNEVRRAVEYGAAEKVLVSSSLLFNTETRDDVMRMLEECERMRTEFHIVDSKSEAGEKLMSLGGIAAKLRYQVE